MRRKWSLFVLAFLLFVTFFLPVGQIHAAGAKVKVTLPTFKVTLNGHTVENQFRQYPLLVYRGITYFPMTWNDTRLLGLESSWSPETGLSIKQSQVTSSYAPNKSNSPNATTYTAQISTSAITVNGKVINNAKEKYPLLIFRNVTYFPLTWRFAHDEFGWEYTWNTASGLSITSHNKQLQTVDLPSYALENDVALFNGYYYFVEKSYIENQVYRAPVKKPSDKEVIYSYSHPDSRTNADLLGPLSFQIRDNTLWFTYRLGGGVMGSDCFVKIDDDGTAELKHIGNFDFRDTPYGTLFIQYGTSVFEGGNMSISTPGQDMTNRTLVGDSGVSYGVYVKINSGEARIPDSSTTVIGDDVYVLASHGPTDLNKIHKINLKTNKSDKIVNTSVSRFQIIDDKLYYVKDENNALYFSELDGTDETKLSEHAVSWFGHIDGNVFYTTKKNKSQYELYKVNTSGEDPLLWPSLITSVHVINDKLVAQLEGSDGVVILDGSGTLLQKVAEPIARVLLSNDGVLLQTSKASLVKVRE